MKELTELSWFTEQWATKVRDATRALVRLYAEALEGPSGIGRQLQLVWVGGFSRPLIILKPLFRSAVVDHIRLVLRHLVLLHVRAFAATRPAQEETRLRIKKTAAAEKVHADEMRVAAFLAQQKRISALLAEASDDVRRLLEAIDALESPGSKAFRSLMRTGRRTLPLLWAGVVIAQFERLASAPQAQLLVFFIGVAAVYHLAALLTLPFHDAGERKYRFFEGYFGTPSDGLKPLFPEGSRRENALFKLLDTKPPIVMSWETVVPVLHYGVMSALLVILLIKLPFALDVWYFALAFSAVLIGIYLFACWQLCKLLKLRYSGRTPMEIVSALVMSFQALELLKDENEDAAKTSQEIGKTV